MEICSSSSRKKKIPPPRNKTNPSLTMACAPIASLLLCLYCTESYLPQRFWREGWISNKTLQQLAGTNPLIGISSDSFLYSCKPMKLILYQATIGNFIPRGWNLFFSGIGTADFHPEALEKARPISPLC